MHDAVTKQADSLGGSLRCQNPDRRVLHLSRVQSLHGRVASSPHAATCTRRKTQNHDENERTKNNSTVVQLVKTKIVKAHSPIPNIS